MSASFSQHLHLSKYHQELNSTVHNWKLVIHYFPHELLSLVIIVTRLWWVNRINYSHAATKTPNKTSGHFSKNKIQTQPCLSRWKDSDMPGQIIQIYIHIKYECVSVCIYSVLIIVMLVHNFFLRFTCYETVKLSKWLFTHSKFPLNIGVDIKILTQMWI